MKNLYIFCALFVFSNVFAATKQDAEDATQRKDYPKAFLIWSELAERNDADAQFWMGNFYDFGKGVEVNKEKAFFWYLKAANGGEITSQENVGNMYRNGIGISKDLKQSAAWFKKAADRGDDSSQFRYGSALHNGEGVKKDFGSAYIYFKMAAMNGNSFAQHAVGLYSTDVEKFQSFNKYEKNKSFFQVDKIGMRWLRIAADAGNQNAIARLNDIDATNSSGKRLRDLIGKAQTGIATNDDAVFARPGVYRKQDAQRTKYGDIGVINEKNNSTFILKDAPLNPNITAKNRISIDQVIEFNNNIYILLMIDDGENDCYGNFRWITLTSKDVNTTDSFGNCSGIADVVVKDGKLMLIMPKYKDKAKQEYIFNG
jgi:TPR repeat protein